MAAQACYKANVFDSLPYLFIYIYIYICIWHVYMYACMHVCMCVDAVLVAALNAALPSALKLYRAEERSKGSGWSDSGGVAFRQVIHKLLRYTLPYHPHLKTRPKGLLGWGWHTREYLRVPGMGLRANNRTLKKAPKIEETGPTSTPPDCPAIGPKSIQTGTDGPLAKGLRGGCSTSPRT